MTSVLVIAANEEAAREAIELIDGRYGQRVFVGRAGSFGLDELAKLYHAVIGFRGDHKLNTHGWYCSPTGLIDGLSYLVRKSSSPLATGGLIVDPKPVTDFAQQNMAVKQMLDPKPVKSQTITHASVDDCIDVGESYAVQQVIAGSAEMLLDSTMNVHDGALSDKTTITYTIERVALQGDRKTFRVVGEVVHGA